MATAGQFAIDEAFSLVDLKRHWCFMGEIVNDQLANNSLFGHPVRVRDREGEIIAVYFQLTATDTLDRSLLKRGNTLFVRYAVQHT